MKIEIELDEDDIKFEVRQTLIKEFKSHIMHQRTVNILDAVLTKEIEKHVKDNGIDRMIKDGVIEYLEKYKIRDVVKELVIR